MSDMQNPFSGLASEASEIASAFAPANPLAPLVEALQFRAGSQAQAQPQVPGPGLQNPVYAPPEPDKSHHSDLPVLDEVEGGFKGHYWAASNLKKALREIRSLGEDLGISSGWRSREDQEYLYRTKGSGMAAAPGTSNHEKGWAFDLSGVTEKGRQVLEKYGFTTPLDWEPWHFTFQPGLPASAGERVWKDDDPRMARFRATDNFHGSPRHVAQSITTAAGYTDKDTSYFMRMWNQESGFDHTARSPVGAMGIGQIMPENLPHVLLKIGASVEEYKKSPAVQIKASLQFMQDQLANYGGNWAQALAAYNGGPGAVDYAREHGAFPASNDPNSWYRQTLDYVATIMDTSRTQAMRWISGSDPGPMVKAPDPDVEHVRTRDSLTNQVQGFVKSIFEVPDVENPFSGFKTPLGSQKSPFSSLLARQEGGPTLDVGTPGLGKPASAKDDPFSMHPAALAPKENGKPMTFAGTTVNGSNFYYNSQGRLVNSQGRPLPPGLTLEADKEGLKLAQRKPGTPAVGVNVPGVGPVEIKGEGRSWKDWGIQTAANVGEVGKTMLRSVIGSLAGVQALQEQVLETAPWMKYSPAAPMLGPGMLQQSWEQVRDKAVEINSNNGVLPLHLLPFPEMLKAVEPTPGGYHAQNKETARNLRGGKGVWETLWAMRPGGEMSWAETSQAGVGNLMDLATELPYLAGLEIGAQFVGPNVGLLSRARRLNEAGGVAEFTGINQTFGVGGKWTFEALSKLPGIGEYVQKLGAPFFQELSIWGNINGAQMATEGFARALVLEGKTPREAAATALTYGIGGYMLGMAVPLGLFLPVGAAAGIAKALPHVPVPGMASGGPWSADVASSLAFAADAFRRWEGKNKIAESVTNLLEFLDENPGYASGAAVIGASMLDSTGMTVPMAAMLPIPKKGWLTARILETASEGLAHFNLIREAGFRNATVRTTMEYAENLHQNAKVITETITRAQDKLDAVQKTHDGAAQIIQQAEAQKPLLRDAASRLSPLRDEKRAWESANSAYMTAQKNPDRQAATQTWMQDYGQALGINSPDEWAKALAAKRKEIATQTQEIVKDTGIREDLILTHLDSLGALKELEVSLAAAKENPVLKNLQSQQDVAQAFTWMGKRVEAIAQAIKAGELPARPPVLDSDPQWNDPLWAEAKSNFNLDIMEGQLADYDAGLESAVRAGLVNDPVKNPLVFQATRYMRALAESKTGLISNQVKSTREALLTERQVLQDLIDKPINATAPRAPSPKEAETNPKYPEMVKAYQKKLAEWEAKKKPILQAEKEMARQKIREIEESILQLDRFSKESSRAGSLSDPDAGELRILEGKAGEITEALEAEIKGAGWSGGSEEVKGLLDRKGRSPRYVLEGFRNRDAGRVGKSPSKGFKAGDRAAFVGPKPKMGKSRSKAAVQQYRQDLAAWKNRDAAWKARVKNRQQGKQAWQAARDQYDATVEEIKQSGPYVWVKDLRRNGLEAYAKTTQSPSTAPAPVGNSTDSIILGKGGKIIDGEARLHQAMAKGKPISAWVPQETWQQMILNTLPERAQKFIAPKDVPVQVDTPWGPLQVGQVQGKINPLTGQADGSVTLFTKKDAVDPMAEAKEWFDNLNPGQKESMLRDEVVALNTVFLEREMPALKRFRELMGAGSTEADLSPEGQKIVGDLKHYFDMNETLREDFRTLHEDHFGIPNLGGMLVRSRATMENWWNKLGASRRVADHVQVELKRMLVDALDLTPKARPGQRPDYGAVEIPKQVREEMVDAIQAMTESPEAMKALVRKYPRLKDALGTYFMVAQQWEKLKLISPEMQSFFRDDVMFHSFPTMREIFRQATSSATRNQLPYTRLVSEQFRKIPTLAEAREFYNKALNAVISGDWSKVKRGAQMTAEQREKYFIQAPEGDRLQILGLGADEKSIRKADITLMHLGLKNPVTDPSVIVGNHIKAVYAADATRTMIKDLANISIPGMTSINPMTGRPYSVVEYIPQGTRTDPISGVEIPGSQGGMVAPFVPSINRKRGVSPGTAATRDQNQAVRKMISLASDEFGMSPHTKIHLGGMEIEAKDLFIHPDVADLIKERFLQGEEFGPVLQGIGEFARAGQLIGAPLAHAFNIMTDHWTMLSSQALNSMISRQIGPAEAAKRLFTAPFEAAALPLAGKKMTDDVRLFADAQLHGANFNTWDAWIRTAAETAYENVRKEMALEPEGMSPAGEWFQGATTKDSLGQAWNRARDSHRQAGSIPGKALAAVKSMGNLGLNLDHTVNNAILFTPIKQGLLAGYHYMSAAIYRDMAPKMKAEGFSEQTIMREAKKSAARLVNTVSGTLQQHQDPQWFRQAVYFPLGLGGFVGTTAPGWYRAKIDALLAPLDGVFAAMGRKWGNGNEWGRLSYTESPALRNYMRKQWWGMLAMGVAGSWAGMQMFSLITTGHPTFNHPDPGQRFRLQHGKFSIPWPFLGFYRDLWKGVDGVSSGDVSKALRAFLSDSTSPFPNKMASEVSANNSMLFQGGDSKIYNPEVSWDLNVKASQGMDIAKYLLTRAASGPIEALGWENPAGEGTRMTIPKWVLQSVTGIRVNDYLPEARFRGEIDRIEKFYTTHIRKEVQADLELWHFYGDKAALNRAMDKALNKGIKLEGVAPKIMEAYGGVYRVDDDTFDKWMESLHGDSRESYGEGLSDEATDYYEKKLREYSAQQKSLARRFIHQLFSK